MLSFLVGLEFIALCLKYYIPELGGKTNIILWQFLSLTDVLLWAKPILWFVLLVLSHREGATMALPEGQAEDTGQNRIISPEMEENRSTPWDSL